MYRNLILSFVLLLMTCTAVAQETTATTAPATTTIVQVAPTGDYDSRETRREFSELLKRHPREVGVVLKLDPTLFRNENYMAAYPALASFVKSHPDVAQNPSYYLEEVWIPGDELPEPASVRTARSMIEGISIFAVLVVIVSGLVWLLRTVLEHRRWSRVSRIQTEIHNKLLDRFSSHEDLLRYIQSAAGKEFIEAATTPVSSGMSSISAPFGRILWSIQVGIVLTTLGIGMQIVSSTLHADVAATISSLGVLSLSAGIGFAISAVASYLVSRKLGILPAPGGNPQQPPPAVSAHDAL